MPVSSSFCSQYVPEEPNGVQSNLLYEYASAMSACPNVLHLASLTVFQKKYFASVSFYNLLY